MAMDGLTSFLKEGISLRLTLLVLPMKSDGSYVLEMRR